MKKAWYITLFVLTAAVIVLFSFFAAVFRVIFKKRQTSPTI